MTRRLLSFLPLVLIPFLTVGLFGQIEDLSSPDPKVREKAVRKLGDKGEKKQVAAEMLCSELAKVVRDPSSDVRTGVVQALIQTNSQHCLPPLMLATKDATPEIQSMAVDGLVNFYVPGYVKFGWFNSLKSFGGELKNRFRDPEPVIVDPYVTVSSESQRAIAPLVTGGSSMESRANAARALGILRGRDGIPELVEGLRSKNSMIIIESARALEKIRDTSVGPDMVFLLRDPDEKVQIAVSETVGQLRTKEAVEPLQDLIKDDDKDVRRAALIALAKIPQNGGEKTFLLYLRDKDNQLRAAAAEGIGRAGSSVDLRAIQDAFAEEKNESARLSMAFAAVMLGDLNMLSYLVDGLNSTFHRMEARPFLVELARDPKVLNELYRPLQTGTRDQKMHLAYVIAMSGTRESEPYLEKLTVDMDSKVAEEAVRQLNNLRARL